MKSGPELNNCATQPLLTTHPRRPHSGFYVVDGVTPITQMDGNNVHYSPPVLISIQNGDKTILSDIYGSLVITTGLSYFILDGLHRRAVVTTMSKNRDARISMGE